MKRISILVAFAVALLLTACAQKQKENQSVETKTLVAYFSATGTTAEAAQKVAAVTGGDLHEIQPAEPYTDADLNWRDKQSRSSVEMADKSSRPAVKNTVENIEKYDTIYVGFPIWCSNNLIALLERSFPGIRKCFDSPVRSDGTQKWVDFAHTFWHVDCVRKQSFNAFSERYRKWCKRHGYFFKQNNAEEVYSFAKNAVVLVPKSGVTKVLVQEAANQLTSISRSVETYRAEMERLASMLPEYPVVMEMYGVGKSFGPQLMAEIGDVRRFERKQALVAFAGIDPMPNQSGDKNVRSNKSSKRGAPYLRKTLFNVMGIYLKCAPQNEPVFQFLERKRSEGKPFYVYVTAASNKFLRRYYAKVRDYLATLDNLPPVDMDSTGLQGSN